MAWTLVERTRIPDEYRLFIGDGKSTHSHFELVYRVTEVDEKNVLRERREYSQPLYLHEHPDLALAFSVASRALRELERAALKLQPSEF